MLGNETRIAPYAELPAELCPAEYGVDACCEAGEGGDSNRGSLYLLREALAPAVDDVGVDGNVSVEVFENVFAVPSH